MSEALKNCRNCHWWVPIEHVGDAGECRRFPPTVVPDYTPKRIKMMSGTLKTLIEAFTTQRYGVFPMTGGSTWCGEWKEVRYDERKSLIEDEQKRAQEAEKFAKAHPGELHRIIP